MDIKKKETKKTGDNKNKDREFPMAFVQPSDSL